MPSFLPESSLTNTDEVVRFSFWYFMLLLDKINMDVTRSWFAFSVLFAITSCSTIVLPLLSHRRKNKVLLIFWIRQFSKKFKTQDNVVKSIFFYIVK